jgi:rare lipoprotein A
MRRRTANGLAVVLSVVSLGAAQGPIRPTPTAAAQKPAVRPAPVAQKKVHTKAYQVGTASWYGSYFDGKATASGEPYNMFDLTAAHPTLPLGPHVRVTNLRNGRTVVVRINDRGPVTPGRIIDLSYSAARVLDVKARGLQRVRLDLVQEPETVALLQPVAY